MLPCCVYTYYLIWTAYKPHQHVVRRCCSGHVKWWGVGLCLHFVVLSFVPLLLIDCRSHSLTGQERVKYMKGVVHRDVPSVILAFATFQTPRHLPLQLSPLHLLRLVGYLQLLASNFQG